MGDVPCNHIPRGENRLDRCQTAFQRGSQREERSEVERSRVTASASKKGWGAVEIAVLHLISGLFPPHSAVHAVLLILICCCCCSRCASSAAPLGKGTSNLRMALGAQNYVTFLGCGGEAEPSLCITTKTERIIFNIPEGGPEPRALIESA